MPYNPVFVGHALVGLERATLFVAAGKLPPRLAEASIAFEPPLPPDLAKRWRDTATWMAPHAKYVAIYDAPFWRDQGLSGSARSALGPLAEVHDVSMPGGHATVLIQTQGLNILTDPVWSERASPVSFAGPKRNNPPGVAFEDLRLPLDTPEVHARNGDRSPTRRVPWVDRANSRSAGGRSARSMLSKSLCTFTFANSW